jgi:hypothetical protein
VLIILFSSCNKDDISNKKKINNYFSYQNLRIKIPNYFYKDKLVSNKWIDKENGSTLNIEIGYSKTTLDDYLKDTIYAIKNVYPDYKALNIKKLSKNSIIMLSTTSIQEVELKFYMLIISFKNSKLIVTIGGKKDVFSEKKYEKFIKSIKKKGIKNDNSKKNIRY